MSTDLGPIEATAERERKLPLPPVLREFARIGGIVLLIGGAQKKA